MAPADLDPLERYAELAARVDARFQQIYQRHRPDMQCGSGCTDCCMVHLTVTLVEAAAIAIGVASLPAAERRMLAERAVAGTGVACAALRADGRCGIYPWRPLVCRSHGAPIRRREPGHLPVIDACPRNFDGGRALQAVAGEDVFDQQTVSTVLGAIDAAFADQQGIARGRRVDLDALLVAPEAFVQIDEEEEDAGLD